MSTSAETSHQQATAAEEKPAEHEIIGPYLNIELEETFYDPLYEDVEYTYSKAYCRRVDPEDIHLPDSPLLREPALARRISTDTDKRRSVKKGKTGRPSRLPTSSDRSEGGSIGPKKDSIRPPGFQAGDEVGSRSYLSTTCSTIQIVAPNRVLLVWHVNFHPGLGKRFQKASIVCKFLQKAGEGDAADDGGIPSSAVSVVNHAPRKAYGGLSTEKLSPQWDVKMPISAGAGTASVDVTPQRAAKMVDHAFTVTGTARGVPRRTNCVWTIEENGSTQRGIPSEIQLAVVLDHSGPFMCEIDVSAQDRGLFPLWPRWLRTKASPEERRRPIDPLHFKGVLKEYDVGEDPVKMDNLLRQWTGETKDAVVQFKQA